MQPSTRSYRWELRLYTTFSAALALWLSFLLYKQHLAKQNDLQFSPSSEGTLIYYPISLKNVLLVPEDPTHYKIYSGGGDEDWNAQFPHGGGRVRLGPENQTYEVTMFHELRCLGAIRRAMAIQSAGDANNAAMLHGCFNYLRELVMCRADTTLEDVISTDLSVNHAYPHVCKDWTALYNSLN